MDIGEQLAAARRDRGMTIAQLSNLTRIRGSLIEAIEADNFAPCGGDVYARGHIRSIAGALGLDADPLIAQFNADNHVAEPPISRIVTRMPPPSAADRKRGSGWMAAVIVVLIGICAVLAYNILGDTGSGSTPPGPAAISPAPSPTHSPASAVSSTSSAEPASPSPTPPASPSPSVPAGVSVQIQAVSGACWYSATPAAGAASQSTLQIGGASPMITDPTGITIRLGAPKSVKLLINGSTVDLTAGSLTNPITLSVTANSPADLPDLAPYLGQQVP